MTCDPKCEMGRGHDGFCRRATGFDSELLTESELQLLFLANEADTRRAALWEMTVSDLVRTALTALCEERRSLQRLKARLG